LDKGKEGLWLLLLVVVVLLLLRENVPGLKGRGPEGRDF
jgi:hypothetical protein